MHRPTTTERLLFVSAGLSPQGGGIAAAGRLLLSATRDWAAERGTAVRVLTLGAKDELPAGLDGTGFDGNRAALALAVWRAQVFEGYRHQIYDFLGTARIQGALPRWLRARYLVYVYGIECWRPLDGSRRRAIHGAAIRLGSSAHTVERFGRDNPTAPVVVPLHLAIAEPAAVTNPDTDLLTRVGEGFVLIVGRLAPEERYKGHDRLIAALAALATSWPQLRLVVAGDGGDKGRLLRLAHTCGVAERVTFTGFVDGDTLEALYRRCAVFAMPSRDEGFGFVYLEAMRSGKPCLALAGSAAAEIVVDGQTGMLVHPEPQAIASGLEEILSDPDRAAAMGEAGRLRWQLEFRPERFAAGFRTHLDALVSDSAGAADESVGSRTSRHQQHPSELDRDASWNGSPTASS